MHSSDTISLTPLRKAQLEEYAQRRGQDPAAALDEAVAAYLEGERQDFEEAVQGIQEGHADMRAGRTRPAAEFLAELRQRHGLSGLKPLPGPNVTRIVS